MRPFCFLGLNFGSPQPSSRRKPGSSCFIPPVETTLPKLFCVYILASKLGGTLYTGVTSDLVARIHQHRTGAIPGFTKRYHVKLLVYFEVHDNAEAAITREKQIKEWTRAWRVELIEKSNPYWHDLYDEITR